MVVADDKTEWVTVRQMMERYPNVLSKNKWYERIADKTVPSIKLGKRVYLPADCLDRMLEAAGESTK